MRTLQNIDISLSFFASSILFYNVQVVREPASKKILKKKKNLDSFYKNFQGKIENYFKSPLGPDYKQLHDKELRDSQVTPYMTSSTPTIMGVYKHWIL